MILKQEDFPNLKNGNILPPFKIGYTTPISFAKSEETYTVTNGNVSWGYKVNYKDKTVTFKLGAATRIVSYNGDVIRSGIVSYKDVAHLCTEAQFEVMSRFANPIEFNDVDLWENFDDLFVETYHNEDRVPVKKMSVIMPVSCNLHKNKNDNHIWHSSLKECSRYKDRGLRIIRSYNGLEYEVYKTKTGIVSRVRNANSSCLNTHREMGWGDTEGDLMFSEKRVSSFEFFSELIGGLSEETFAQIQGILECNYLDIPNQEGVRKRLCELYRANDERELLKSKELLENESDELERFSYRCLIRDRESKLKNLI